MDLFHNHPQELNKNPQIRAIKKCISNKNNAFDKLRLKMINEIKK